MNPPVIYLNNNDGTGMLAFGEGPRLPIRKGHILNDLTDFLNEHEGKYIFLALAYDLKNEIEELHSGNADRVDFPEAFVWVPEHVVSLDHEHFDFVQGEKDEESFEFLNKFLEEETDQNFHHNDFSFEPRITKEEYIATVNTLKDHLQRGDIYEVNFCQEYFAENARLPFPLDTYFKMNAITRAPFSAYLQFDEYTAMCGSPERFLKKEGDRLISQPIKGTAPRSTDPEIDRRLREDLAMDPKERSENVMIVDLVRNDLSRIAQRDSVQVDELFGIYSFETVHQMISTISCKVREDVSFTDILKATFPMGSMTGAPKIRAMQLIEEAESFKRGLFSGTIGYIAANGDFNLNVVIRTLVHNAEKAYLSCSVGSAITIKSDPEKEYEECQVKIRRILDGMNA